MLSSRYFFTQFCGEFTADVLEEFLVEDIIYIKKKNIEDASNIHIDKKVRAEAEMINA